MYGSCVYPLDRMLRSVMAVSFRKRLSKCLDSEDQISVLTECACTAYQVIV